MAIVERRNARARVCISPAPQSPSPELEITCSLRVSDRHGFYQPPILQTSGKIAAKIAVFLHRRIEVHGAQKSLLKIRC